MLGASTPSTSNLDLRAAGRAARRPLDRGRRPRRPPGHRPDAPRPAHGGHADLRHADRGRLRRAGSLQAYDTLAARDARRARPEDHRELHALGTAARSTTSSSPTLEEDVLHLLNSQETSSATWASGRASRGHRSRSARALEQVADTRDVDVIFGRLPRINSLSGAARAVARELVRWREDLAERQDRPVTTVLNDAALVEIAKRSPRTPAALEQIRGVNPGSLRRRGEELLATIAHAATLPPIAAESSHHEATVSTDGPQILRSPRRSRARGRWRRWARLRADRDARRSRRGGRERAHGPARGRCADAARVASGTGRSGSPHPVARRAQRRGRARRPPIRLGRRLRAPRRVPLIREARHARRCCRGARCLPVGDVVRGRRGWAGGRSRAEARRRLPARRPRADPTRGSQRGRG